MSGRGDNNKNGIAGQGASNQSNQGANAADNSQPKSNHGQKTGTNASEPQAKKADKSANRDLPKKGSNKKETF